MDSLPPIQKGRSPEIILQKKRMNERLQGYAPWNLIG
jgi:hypothetical protein